jgi:phosphoribosylformylglycinamidine synthase
VWHREGDLQQPDAVIVPGGFAYGDYLRAGAIARFSPVMQAVERFAADGGPVLGICNGFQVLCEAGLLPGALVRNKGQLFLARPVTVRVDTTDTPFTAAYRKGQVLVLPVAHGEGRYVATAETVQELEQDERVVLRYVDQNPNGSIHEIAGITNARRNVVGIMPHPERAADPVVGNESGRGIFESLVLSPAH